MVLILIYHRDIGYDGLIGGASLCDGRLKPSHKVTLYYIASQTDYVCTHSVTKGRPSRGREATRQA